MRKFILKIVVCITLLICCLPTTIKADDKVAMIERTGVQYTTLKEAMENAVEGDVVYILKDITLVGGPSELNQIGIDKSLTIQGFNDQVMTITRNFDWGPAVNIGFDDPSVVVTIKDLIISNENGDTAIHINSNKGKINLDNVRATASTNPANLGFALLFSFTSNSLTVDISNCYFKGVSGIFVRGTNHTINVDNTDIISTVDSVTTDDGAIVLYYELVPYPDGAYGTQVTITDSRISANNNDNYYAIIDKARGSSVRFDESTASNLVGKIYTVVAVDSDNNMYESLQQAIDDNIDNDKTVILYKDINLNDTINIEGEITIKSYDKNTLTSSADPAINIKTPGPVTIEYLKIENVSGNAVNISDTVENTELNIDQCDLTGYSALAVYGKGATVNVNVSNLTGVNDKEYGDGSNNHSTIFVANKNVSITVNNFPFRKVIAESTEGKAKQWIAGADPGSSEGLQLYINSEFETNGSAAIYGFDPEEGLNVKVRAQYANQLKSEGFRVSAPDGNGMITVLGFLPPTGDDINISIWTSIMLASVVGILGAIVYGKKKKLI
ncbi:MAG: hypothetical protein ACOX1M_03845 [Erysipelotrichaceae bacterium]